MVPERYFWQADGWHLDRNREPLIEVFWLVSGSQFSPKFSNGDLRRKGLRQIVFKLQISDLKKWKSETLQNSKNPKIVDPGAPIRKPVDNYRPTITNFSEISDGDPRSMILGLFEFCDFRMNFDAGGVGNFDQFWCFQKLSTYLKIIVRHILYKITIYLGTPEL